jgi:hypothetical protein
MTAKDATKKLASECLSLDGLKPEDALRKALAAPPPKTQKKPKKGQFGSFVGSKL